MTKFILSLLLFITCSVYPQKGFILKNKIDSIDAFAKTVKYKNSFERLSSDLTKNYDSDLHKARAIFTWITENIAYDYKFVNKGKKIKPPKYKKRRERGEVYREWEDKLLTNVILGKKAICDGYARLFKRLCNEAGIQCSVVSGYSKQMPKQVGTLGRQDHAWNAMLIDGKYYYVDATWASGYCIRNKKGKLKKFIKEFDDYYWLTPAEKFHRNHFPKEKEWLEHIPYAKEQYRNSAWINNSLAANLDLITPESGVLNAKVGDTIHFRINYLGFLDEIEIATNRYDIEDFWEDQVNSENEAGKEFPDENPGEYKKYYIPYLKKEDVYEFYYIIDSKSIRFIDIYFNYNHAMRFKVKISP